MKVFTLVGKKLLESSPEELLKSMVGMIIDDKDEMIRLIISPDTRKKQRELLMQESAEYNKREFAGTFLVSQIENPELVKSLLEEAKKIQAGEILKDDSVKTTEKKQKAKDKKKKKSEEPQEIVEDTTILSRWEPELVKKTVSFLDGKTFVHLYEIQEAIGTTEGEAYWLTQDLIHIGIIPGRWTGYPDGQWVYQILSEQPLAKSTTKKTKVTTKKK